MIEEVVDKSADVMTDSASMLDAAPMGHKHSKANHSIKEYVRHEDGVCITTNTVESYFAIIKAWDRRDLSPRWQELLGPISSRVRLSLQRARHERC